MRDLCLRFNTPLSDEHCAFLTASYIKEFKKGVIFIDFKEFLTELKDVSPTKVENLELLRSKGLSISESIGSEDSLGDMAESSRYRETFKPNRSQRMTRGSRKSMEDEYMLDVAETIFVRLA